MAEFVCVLFYIKFFININNLLNSVSRGDVKNIDGLELLEECEQLKLVEKCSHTTHAVSDKTSLLSLFQQQLASRPNEVAVITENNEFTFQEINRQALILANHLVAQGVKPEQMVAMLLTRSELLPVAILAIFYTGATYLPLDPEYPLQRIQYILEDAKVAHIVLEESLAELVADEKAVKIFAPQVIAEQQNANNLAAPESPQSLAYVIYTSGSTGNPKGVMIKQQNLTNFLLSMAREPGLSAEDTILAVTTISFDIAVLEILLPLSVGATSVIVSRNASYDPVAITQLLTRHDITLMQATPSTWQMLLAAQWHGKSNLKVLTGGESLPQSLASQLFPIVAEVWNMYGPTETTVWSTCYRIKSATDKPLIGKPIDNTQVYILDENQKLVPEGVPGELCIGGSGVTKGYLGMQAMTNEKFIANPFSLQPDELIYRTGDQVRYVADYNIEYISRLDFQVKVRGYRIELGEIETVLNQFAGVEQAVVIVREDKENDKRIVAYYISQENKTLEANLLRAHLNESLPSYMVPQNFEKLSAFPLTPNGKIDRKALPKPSASDKTSKHIRAPKSSIEIELAAIWQKLLGLEQIDLNDNFFEVGGHSLIATQLVSKIGKAFKIDMPVSEVFAAPTLKQQADFIQNSASEESLFKGITIRTDDRHLPSELSDAQLRLWILEKLEPTSLIFNMPVILKFAGQVDAQLLSQCIQDFVARHPSMRTTFVINEGEKPLQQVHQTISFEIKQSNYINDSKFELDSYLEKNFPHSCNLIDGPLFSFEIIKTQIDELILLGSIHHLIFDGWSAQQLVQEITEQYACLEQQQVYQPVISEVEYSDYAYWQKEWNQSESMLLQKQYWLEKLSGELPVLELPTQFARPPVQSFKGERIGIKLDDAIFEKAKIIAQELDVTPFMLFLTTYYVLLHRTTNQRDIIVGIPVANRRLADIENTIGCFVNTIALRTQLKDDDTFMECLIKVKQISLQAFDNQDFPFEKIIAELDGKRDLTRTPVFQTTFNFQERPANRQINEQLDVSIHPWSRSVTKTDTSLSIIRQNQTYSVYFEYSTDLFELNFVSELLATYQSLFEQVINDPAMRLKDYRLVNAEEQIRLKALWNETNKEYSNYSGVHQYFENLAEQLPSNIAIQHKSQQITYHQLNQLANQFAGYLESCGVKQGDKIGVLADFSIETIASLLGVMKVGAAYVPLDFDDPRARLNKKAEHFQLSLIITQSDVKNRLIRFSNKLFELSTFHSVVAKFSTDYSSQDLGRQLPILFNFVSTNMTNLVVLPITHASLLNRLHWTGESELTLSQDNVLLQDHLSSDQALSELILAWSTGAKISIVNNEKRRNVEYIHQVIQQNSISTALFDIEFLQELMLNADQQKLASVKKYFVFGKYIDNATQLAFAKFSDAELHFMYGEAEVAGHATHWRCDLKSPTKRKQIGLPIANTQLYILDEELNNVPIGASGGLYIGGAGIANVTFSNANYEQQILVGSLEVKQKLFKTGTIVRYSSEGVVEFVKQQDQKIQLRGHRIHLQEISGTIKALSEVDECVVVLNQEQPNNLRLVAYFSKGSNKTICKEELRTQISKLLPSYMIPSIFVEINQWSKNILGEIDVSQLPKLEELKNDSLQNTLFPRTELEKSIALIWQQLLDVEQVTLLDNFIELGGHSFLALQAIAQVKKELNLNLTPLSLIRDNLQQISASIEGTILVENTVAATQVITETIKPYYFANDLSLFGTFHAANSRKPVLGAVLLCSPTYMEQINAHWAYRRLATQLANAGFHVLRFDYFATGDSLGDDQEADVSRWLEDINVASEELLRVSELSTLSIVGLRFGATLASLTQVKNVDHLVLWEPIINGETYVTDLLKKYRGTLQDLNYIRKQPAQAQPCELIGFQFPDAIAQSISQTNLAQGDLIRSASRVSLVTSNQLLVSEELKIQLTQKNSNFHYCFVDDTSPSIENYTDLAAFLPGKSLNTIINQLKANQLKEIPL